MNETPAHAANKRQIPRSREQPGASGKEPLKEPAKDPSAPDPPAETPAAKAPSLLKDTGFLLLKVAAIVLAFVLLFTFMYGLHRGADPSMNPAVKDGDLVMYYRLDKTYVAGDVLLLEFGGQTQVRRVVAVAGDVVDINEDGLIINGARQQEPNIYEQTERYVEGAEFPITVGEGQVFVLADAREGATDSRVYGAVDLGDTLGKVIAILRRRNI